MLKSPKKYKKSVTFTIGKETNVNKSCVYVKKREQKPKRYFLHTKWLEHHIECMGK